MTATFNRVHAESIKVFLVDDHPALRRGIADCISGHDDLTVCGEAGDAKGAMAGIARCTPDVVVVDISLPGQDGISLIKDLRVSWPGVRILVISMHDESLYAERALRAGAVGYLEKNASLPEMIEAIRRTYRGEFTLGKKAVSLMAARMAGKPGSAPMRAVECLSDREMEIYCLLGEGLGRREIANRLSVSVKTVETHRSNMKEKLGLRNALELHRHAMDFYRSQAAQLSLPQEQQPAKTDVVTRSSLGSVARKALAVLKPGRPQSHRRSQR